MTILLFWAAFWYRDVIILVSSASLSNERWPQIFFLTTIASNPKNRQMIWNEVEKGDDITDHVHSNPRNSTHLVGWSHYCDRVSRSPLRALCSGLLHGWPQVERFTSHKGQYAYYIQVNAYYGYDWTILHGCSEKFLVFWSIFIPSLYTAMLTLATWNKLHDCLYAIALWIIFTRGKYISR